MELNLLSRYELGNPGVFLGEDTVKRFYGNKFPYSGSAADSEYIWGENTEAVGSRWRLTDERAFQIRRYASMADGTSTFITRYTHQAVATTPKGKMPTLCQSSSAPPPPPRTGSCPTPTGYEPMGSYKLSFVEYDDVCYYMDGSGGICMPGYAPQPIYMPSSRPSSLSTCVRVLLSRPPVPHHMH